MRTTPLEDRIFEMSTPVATDLGLEIVCVNAIGSDGGQVIQVMAEDPATGNLGVDHCAKLSKAISVVMDVEDPINGKYRLEVSSPGIDRPLVREKDFETYTGFVVKLETTMPNMLGQKRFRGRITDFKDGTIHLQTDTELEEIDFADLAKAKLVLNDELIQKSKKKQKQNKQDATT